MIIRGTFWFMIVAGLNVNFSDVYKSHGFKDVARRRIRFIDNICTSIIDSLDDWKSWLYTTIFPFVAHSRLKLFFNNWHYFFTTVIGNRRFAAEFLELFFEDYIRIRNCIGSFYWNSQAVFQVKFWKSRKKHLSS